MKPLFIRTNLEKSQSEKSLPFYLFFFFLLLWLFFSFFHPNDFSLFFTFYFVFHFSRTTYRINPAVLVNFRGKRLAHIYMSFTIIQTRYISNIFLFLFIFFFIYFFLFSSIFFFFSCVSQSSELFAMRVCT